MRLTQLELVRRNIVERRHAPLYDLYAYSGEAVEVFEFNRVTFEALVDTVFQAMDRLQHRIARHFASAGLVILWGSSDEARKFLTEDIESLQRLPNTHSSAMLVSFDLSYQLDGAGRFCLTELASSSRTLVLPYEVLPGLANVLAEERSRLLASPPIVAAHNVLGAVRAEARSGAVRWITVAVDDGVAEVGAPRITLSISESPDTCKDTWWVDDAAQWLLLSLSRLSGVPGPAMEMPEAPDWLTIFIRVIETEPMLHDLILRFSDSIVEETGSNSQVVLSVSAAHGLSALIAAAMEYKFVHPPVIVPQDLAQSTPVISWRRSE